MKLNSPQFNKLFIAPKKSKRSKAKPKRSLQKDIRREANINLIRDAGIGAADALKGLRLPKFIKSYKPTWKDVIIALLIGLLIGMTHIAHARTIGGDFPIIPSKPLLKPKAALKVPDLKPQEQLASIYIAPVISTPITAVSGCGDNFYANFIYMHESGCNASAINPYSGAGGVGQALPFSKTGCALGDYGCQDAWFTGYANSTYGGWAGAYAFWQIHSWW